MMDEYTNTQIQIHKYKQTNAKTENTTGKGGK